MLFWPQRAFTPPQLFGAEELGNEKRRLLFVGNHAILGIDVTWFMIEGFDRPLAILAFFLVVDLEKLPDALLPDVPCW